MPSLRYGKSLPTPKTGYGVAVGVVLDASFGMHVRILRLTNYDAAPKHFDRLRVNHRNFYECPNMWRGDRMPLVERRLTRTHGCDAHRRFDRARDPNVPIRA